MSDAQRQHCLLLVEGHHDLEFVGKLLRTAFPGFVRVRESESLDPFWEVLTKLSFPQDGDLTKRMEVPGFFQSDRISIAIVAANSVSALVAAGKRTLLRLDTLVPDNIGIVLDADSSDDLSTRFSRLKEQLQQQSLFPPLPDEMELGTVPAGSPRMGVFIMPNCLDAGTLEDLLLECSDRDYSHLKTKAEAFVGSIEENHFASEDLKEWRKPAGRKKATVSAMAAVLKPAKSIQVSIHDNRWVSEVSIQSENLQKLLGFLKDLLAIDTSEEGAQNT